MPIKLFSPYILGFKNDLLNKAPKSRSQVLGFIAATIVVSLCVFYLVFSILHRSQQEAELASLIPYKIINLSFLSFFCLLLFSNTVIALGEFYITEELTLLLSVPITAYQLFSCRLVLTTIRAGWIFILFLLPSSVAFIISLNLPWWTFFLAVGAAIPFLIIPTAIGYIAVTLFVNAIPPNRVREILVALAIIIMLLVFYVGSYISEPLLFGKSKYGDALVLLALVDNPNPAWLPSRWISDIMIAFIHKNPIAIVTPSILLLTTAIALTALSFVTFDCLFIRGLSMRTNCKKSNRYEPKIVQQHFIAETITKILLPFNPQLRAFVYKDMRMFFRDTTQTLQLMLLLLLTILYLYNFKALRTITDISTEWLSWWQALLCISNLTLGMCVISAICTRFVFPSVSLEGRAYWVIRSAPISIEEFLFNKFMVAIAPISTIAIILVVSGALAIQAPPYTIAMSAGLAFTCCIGSVGLAVGIGALCAKFDWTAPSQLSAHMGSLLYLMATSALMLLNLIPVSILTIMVRVEYFVAHINNTDYTLIIICAALLLLYINVAALKYAITIGAQSLSNLEG